MRKLFGVCHCETLSAVALYMTSASAASQLAIRTAPAQNVVSEFNLYLLGGDALSLYPLASSTLTRHYR